MHRVLLLTLIGVVSLAVVGAASAIEPTRDTIVLTSRTTNPCPSGVALTGVFSVVREITTFYDQDGQQVRRSKGHRCRRV